MLLCLALFAPVTSTTVAIVGTHSPIGRLASISAASRGLPVAKISHKNTGVVLHGDTTFSILLVDGAAVSSHGLHTLATRHPDAVLIVMQNASDVDRSLAYVENVIKMRPSVLDQFFL